ncbi:hypothetical protein IMZ48_09025 [Candidatus Bathyarchaeota archaeon]|nr:hypothetical protein [Candidatus Bathyarchaeota archaeon]
MSEEQEIPKALTAVEMAFVRAVLRYSKANIPTEDWNKVAEEVGVKDAKCARERFRQISVKHSFGSGEGGSPRKNASPKKAGDSAGAGDMPAKVVKKRAPRAKKPKKEAESVKEEVGSVMEENVEDQSFYATVQDALASEI